MLKCAGTQVFGSFSSSSALLPEAILFFFSGLNSPVCCDPQIHNNYSDLSPKFKRPYQLPPDHLLGVQHEAWIRSHTCFFNSLSCFSDGEKKEVEPDDPPKHLPLAIYYPLPPCLNNKQNKNPEMLLVVGTGLSPVAAILYHYS